MANLVATTFTGDVSLAGNATLRANGQVDATSYTGNGAGLSGIASFDAGTKMVFYQASAPTGWTQDTTAALANTAMSIVTGTGGGTGGTDSFYSTFAAGRNADASGASVSVTGTVGLTTLSTPQIPSHSHPNGASTNPILRGTPSGPGMDKSGTGGAGGGGSHGHPFSVDSSSLSGTISMPNMNVKYANVIIATKD